MHVPLMAEVKHNRSLKVAVCKGCIFMAHPLYGRSSCFKTMIFQDVTPCSLLDKYQVKEELPGCILPSVLCIVLDITSEALCALPTWFGHMRLTYDSDRFLGAFIHQRFKILTEENIQITLL
jgi:hypothetical protein